MIKGKYKQLYLYFKECQKDEITLTFKMIEKIIKDRLPKSARMYNAFWSNDISHNIALSWLKAGYNSFGLDLLNERISFVRIKTDYIKETTKLIIDVSMIMDKPLKDEDFYILYQPKGHIL